MSSGFSKFGVVVLAWVAAGYWTATRACAQGKAQSHRSIELSETNSAEILTNLNLLTIKKDTSRQLEEQLKLLKGLSTPNSLEQRFSVPYVPPTALPTRRVKEQNTWKLTPDDLNLTPDAAETDPLASWAEGKSTSKKSLQQFYENLAVSGTESGASAQKKKNSSSSSDSSQDQFESNRADDGSGLPPGIREKTQPLRDYVNGDLGNVINAPSAHSTFDDFFGLKGAASAGVAAASAAQDSPLKTPSDSFIEQFKKALDPATALNLNPALSALVPGASSPGTPIAADLNKLPTTTHQETAAPSSVNPNAVLDPTTTTLSDENTTVLNQWNPLYTPSKLVPPKYTPPTPPDLLFPRRRF